MESKFIDQMFIFGETTRDCVVAIVVVNDALLKNENENLKVKNKNKKKKTF